MFEKIISIFRKNEEMLQLVFETKQDDLLLNFIECSDVNESTIRRFTVSPACSSIARIFTVYNPYDVKIFFSPPDTGKYIIPVGVAHSPEEWCGPDFANNGFDKRYPDRKNLFEHIPKKYLDDLKQGRAFLLIDQTHEGYQTSWLWDWFHNSCATYNINPKNIIYVTGNLNCADQYEEYCTKNSINDRLFALPLAHFEHTIYEIATNYNKRSGSIPGRNGPQRLPDFKTHKVYKNKTALKTFNILQKRPRGHRIWIFQKLVEHGLLDSCEASMNYFDIKDTYFEGKAMSLEDYQKIVSLLPLQPCENPVDYNEQNFMSGDGGIYVLLINHLTMLRTYCTVVSEASFGESELSCFLSEKTFKPIACQHPFIIAGSKNSLKHLHAMGYKTFEGAIDESYDSLDTWQRLDAIIKTMLKIENLSHSERDVWYNSTAAIVDHNYKNLMERGETYPIRLIKTLMERISNV